MARLVYRRKAHDEITPVLPILDNEKIKEDLSILHCE